MTQSDWTEEPPTEIGMYWFYGFTNGDHEGKRGESLTKPGWHLCEFMGIKNGVLTKVGGVFDWDRSPMVGHYCKVKLPKLPVDAQTPVGQSNNLDAG